MKRYKFLFSDGTTFSVVASSINEAERMLINPIQLLSITKLGYY